MVQLLAFIQEFGFLPDFFPLQVVFKIFCLLVVDLGEADVPDGYVPSAHTLHWSAVNAVTQNGITISPATLLDHEADHAVQSLKHPKQQEKDGETKDKDYTNKEERRVITGREQKTARALGEIKNGQVTRRNHRGTRTKVANPTSTESSAEKNIFNILKDKKDLQNKRPPPERRTPCIGCDGPPPSHLDDIPNKY